MRQAYKLLRLRKDGTLGPLFIGRQTVVPVGKWVKARPIRTKGFAFRPGWHACEKPVAPHLSMRGRIWCRVSLRGAVSYRRPAAQGGLWFVASHLRVEELLRARADRVR
jgi:hypothetical protein